MAPVSRVRLNIRLSPQLKEALQVKAAANHRNLNQEICVALERHVREQYRIM